MCAGLLKIESGKRTMVNRIISPSYLLRMRGDLFWVYNAFVVNLLIRPDEIRLNFK